MSRMQSMQKFFDHCRFHGKREKCRGPFFQGLHDCFTPGSRCCNDNWDTLGHGTALLKYRDIPPGGLTKMDNDKMRAKHSYQAPRFHRRFTRGNLISLLLKSGKKYDIRVLSN